MKTFIKISVVITGLIAAVFFLLRDKSGMVTFATTYGTQDDEVGRDVVMTDDGGYLVVGSTRPYIKPASSFYLVKTDGSGDMLWETVLAEKSEHGGKAVIRSHDGGYLILGEHTLLKASFTDIYLIKLDSRFNKVWEKSYGGKKKESAVDIISTDDGGYAILAVSFSFGNKMVGYLIKTDENGDKLWEKTFRKGADAWYTLMQTHDSGYFIVGITNSNIAVNSRSIYLIKMDKNGDKLWEKLYGGEGGELAPSITKTDDGNYALFGWTYTYGKLPPNMYLIKIDENGDIIWDKVVGDDSYERGWAICTTSDGGFALLGNKWLERGKSLIKRIEGEKRVKLDHDQNLYLVKLDRDGNEEWSNLIGGEDTEAAYQVLQAPDGGYVLLGTTDSYGMGERDIFFVKTDKKGHVSIW